MPSRLDLEFARRLSETARSRYPDDRIEIRLFGSRARGDHHEDSDLDVLVLRDSEDRDTRTALLDLGWDIAYELELPYPASLQVMSRSHFQRLLALETLYARDIQQHGVVI